MNFLGQVVQWFLSPNQWQGDTGIPNRLFEHVLMSAAALLAAALIALPLGITLGHFGRGGALAINLSNVGRAVPSFALLVLAVQLVGIGVLPAFIALVALGVPPIVTNSYVGMREVDPDVREAATGMGMRQRAVLLKVELPLSLPLIMAGIRTSAVNIVATATLAALVAWGGLGRFIVDGLSQRDFAQLFSGALLVALLSIAVELSMARAQRLVVPRGLQLAETGQRR
jgi:osmoprotectant transport system permease protein